MARYRVLFVTPGYHPYNLADDRIYVIEPLQFEVLSALLDPLRFEVRLLDRRLDKRPGALRQALEEFRPQLVGTSAWTMHLNLVRRLCAQVKAFDSSIVTVVGGHHASVAPEDLADPNVDFIAMGEAYPSFGELAERLARGASDASGLPGIAQKREGAFHSPGAANLTPALDLDTLPAPDRGLIAPYRGRYFHLWWKPVAAMRTSMGCPARCAFCNLWRPNQGKYLTFSPERVVDELSRIDEPYVLFVDDHFFADTRRATEIAERILSAGVRKQYCLYSRSDTLAEHPELVALWARAGLKRVRCGLESYSDQELAELEKANSVENNDRAIALLKRHGVVSESIFIVKPEYGVKEFNALVRYVKDRGIELPNFTVHTPMPGTAEHAATRERFDFTAPEYFDFQHAVTKTRLDPRLFSLLFGSMLLRVHHPTLADVRTYGLWAYLYRLPSVLRYFLAVFTSYRHYQKPPEQHDLPALLPWLGAAPPRAVSPGSSERPEPALGPSARPPPAEVRG